MAMNYHRKPWTDAERIRVLSLKYQYNWRVSQIATKLGRTVSAVTTELHNIKYTCDPYWED